MGESATTDPRFFDDAISNFAASIRLYPTWLTQKTIAVCEVSSKVSQLSELELAAVA
jgi:hypothetical protein